MARKKKEEGSKGSPAWMSTFSDLMNLLLCFFVLLYSMSTVDAEKFQEVIASLQSSVSILPSGGASIGEGQMISAGVRQLEFLDSYYSEMANSKTDDANDENTQDGTNNVYEAYKEQELAESEQMASEIQDAVKQSGIEEQVDIDFNSEYVQLNLSGAILFETGQSDLMTEAYPLMDKIDTILEKYKDNLIEVEGHTDNVPIHNSKYPDNNVLSMYRALSVADYMRGATDIDPSHIKSSGRGDYVPIADNSTTEGRALNRRVVIKIYNSYNSDFN
ncbi:flagellar motor protein MotB [Roseburia sp. MUC/MUC-530-WT-4D]|uniref:Flagellar motor protein MotB n=1 Tax=Roseburia porci TaxID=2605790 RepID=A0A6L5YR84_9FIRM|nr:flagellar motor protein MotB [Roseburia porci]